MPNKHLLLLAFHFIVITFIALQINALNCGDWTPLEANFAVLHFHELPIGTDEPEVEEEANPTAEQQNAAEGDPNQEPASIADVATSDTFWEDLDAASSGESILDDAQSDEFHESAHESAHQRREKRNDKQELKEAEEKNVQKGAQEGEAHNNSASKADASYRKKIAALLHKFNPLKQRGKQHSHDIIARFLAALNPLLDGARAEKGSEWNAVRVEQVRRNALKVLTVATDQCAYLPKREPKKKRPITLNGQPQKADAAAAQNGQQEENVGRLQGFFQRIFGAKQQRKDLGHGFVHCVRYVFAGHFQRMSLHLESQWGLGAEAKPAEGDGAMPVFVAAHYTEARELAWQKMVEIYGEELLDKLYERNEHIRRKLRHCSRVEGVLAQQCKPMLPAQAELFVRHFHSLPMYEPVDEYSRAQKTLYIGAKINNVLRTRRMQAEETLVQTGRDFHGKEVHSQGELIAKLREWRRGEKRTQETVRVVLNVADRVCVNMRKKWLIVRLMEKGFKLLKSGYSVAIKGMGIGYSAAKKGIVKFLSPKKEEEQDEWHDVPDYKGGEAEEHANIDPEEALDANGEDEASSESGVQLSAEERLALSAEIESSHVHCLYFFAYSFGADLARKFENTGELVRAYEKRVKQVKEVLDKRYQRKSTEQLQLALANDPNYSRCKEVEEEPADDQQEEEDDRKGKTFEEHILPCASLYLDLVANDQVVPSVGLDAEGGHVEVDVKLPKEQDILLKDPKCTALRELLMSMNKHFAGRLDYVKVTHRSEKKHLAKLLRALENARLKRAGVGFWTRHLRGDWRRIDPTGTIGELAGALGDIGNLLRNIVYHPIRDGVFRPVRRQLFNKKDAYNGPPVELKQQAAREKRAAGMRKQFSRSHAFNDGGNEATSKYYWDAQHESWLQMERSDHQSRAPAAPTFQDWLGLQSPELRAKHDEGNLGNMELGKLYTEYQEAISDIVAELQADIDALPLQRRLSGQYAALCTAYHQAFALALFDLLEGEHTRDFDDQQNNQPKWSTKDADIQHRDTIRRKLEVNAAVLMQTMGHKRSWELRAEVKREEKMRKKLAKEQEVPGEGSTANNAFFRMFKKAPKQTDEEPKPKMVQANKYSGHELKYMGYTNAQTGDQLAEAFYKEMVFNLDNFSTSWDNTCVHNDAFDAYTDCFLDAGLDFESPELSWVGANSNDNPDMNALQWAVEKMFQKIGRSARKYGKRAKSSRNFMKRLWFRKSKDLLQSLAGILTGEKSMGEVIVPFYGFFASIFKFVWKGVKSTGNAIVFSWAVMRRFFAEVNTEAARQQQLEKAAKTGNNDADQKVQVIVVDEEHVFNVDTAVAEMDTDGQQQQSQQPNAQQSVERAALKKRVAVGVTMLMKSVAKQGDALREQSRFGLFKMVYVIKRFLVTHVTRPLARWADKLRGKAAQLSQKLRQKLRKRIQEATQNGAAIDDANADAQQQAADDDKLMREELFQPEDTAKIAQEHAAAAQKEQEQENAKNSAQPEHGPMEEFVFKKHKEESGFWTELIMIKGPKSAIFIKAAFHGSRYGYVVPGTSHAAGAHEFLGFGTTTKGSNFYVHWAQVGHTCYYATPGGPCIPYLPGPELVAFLVALYVMGSVVYWSWVVMIALQLITDGRHWSVLLAFVVFSAALYSAFMTAFVLA